VSIGEGAKPRGAPPICVLLLLYVCFDARYLGIAKLVHLVTHATGTAKAAAGCASGYCLFKSMRVSVLNAALTRRWQRSSLATSSVSHATHKYLSMPH
jgi:hypothetical protein